MIEQGNERSPDHPRGFALELIQPHGWRLEQAQA
jgi:hypothetical protein